MHSDMHMIYFQNFIGKGKELDYDKVIELKVNLHQHKYCKHTIVAGASCIRSIFCT